MSLLCLQFDLHCTADRHVVCLNYITESKLDRFDVDNERLTLAGCWDTV